MTIDRDRWLEIEQILDEAFDLEGDERGAYLDAKCRDRPDLRKSIDDLLEAEARAPRFLEMDAGSFAAPAAGDDFGEDLSSPPFELEQRLGAYRLVREIGHGGMSVVYLAERADGQFDRKVAIKLLRHLGGTHEERVRRFKVEQQILATLDHTHIARVYDGGITSGGWPYLAMEMVDGRTITEYCRALQLSVDDRLRLFDEVCTAVQHAHQHLVVHRDLKPGNILVTETGHVKLLDFGIAKLLDEDDTSPGAAPATATGIRLLTPQYAAPEQVRGGAISTATDVYALGLLLFELLCGSKPYVATGKSATELEKVVCEIDPPRPSTRTVEAGGAGIPEPPARLRTILEGDLDAVILKALRKNPSNRYGSVEELRADLSRYRDGRPVRARPTTTAYRIRKYARRNRIALAIATVIALMLASFAGVTLLQQQETAKQRDQARLEARKATEVTSFLLGLFEASDPAEALGEKPTAYELLERGAQRAASLRDQPTIQAEVMTVVGRAYHALGEFDKADSMLTIALDLRRQLAEAGSGTTGDASIDLQTLARTVGELASVKTELAHYDAADSLFKEAITLLQRDDEATDSLNASLNNDYAFLKQRRGDLAGAESLHTVALYLRRWGGDGRTSLEFAESLHNLAETVHQLGRYAEADSLYLDALSIRKSRLQEIHPSVSSTLVALARNRELLGDNAVADSLYRVALDAQQRVLGPDHPTVASTAMQLANLLASQARYEAAKSLHTSVLDSRKRTLGEDHPDVGESIFSLAYLATLEGAYVDAEQFYRSAIDLWMPTLGDDHPYVALAYNNLAYALSLQGRYQEYVQINREVLRRHEEKFGPDSPHVGVSLGNLSDGLIELGLFGEAEIHAQRALDLRMRQFGESNSVTADSFGLLAKLRLRQRRYAEAEKLERTALRIRNEVLGPSHPRVAYSLLSLANIAWAMNRRDAAAAHFEEGLSIRRQALGDRHPETIKLATDYLAFCKETGRNEKADDLARLVSSHQR